MAEPRYFIQAVAGRNRDSLTGPFLGRTTTLTDAFTVIGEAIEKDQGSGGRTCCTLFVTKRMTPGLGLSSKRSGNEREASVDTAVDVTFGVLVRAPSPPNPPLEPILNASVRDSAKV
jgi:hypothetical protein